MLKMQEEEELRECVLSILFFSLSILLFWFSFFWDSCRLVVLVLVAGSTDWDALGADDGRLSFVPSLLGVAIGTVKLAVATPSFSIEDDFAPIKAAAKLRPAIFSKMRALMRRQWFTRWLDWLDSVCSAAGENRSSQHKEMSEWNMLSRSMCVAQPDLYSFDLKPIVLELIQWRQQLEEISPTCMLNAIAPSTDRSMKLMEANVNMHR